MLILGKRKRSVPTLLAFLIIFVSKSTSAESLQGKFDKNDDAEGTPVPVTSKVLGEKDNALSNSEEKLDDAEEEKRDQSSNPNDKEENQQTKQEESELPSQVVDFEPKQSNVKDDDANQQPSVPQEEKIEEINDSQKLTEEAKKQNLKIDDNSRKNSLSDVNSVTYDESFVKPAKRETRATEFLGLPRDASYFFEDLEPFINNNSVKDNIRALRAIPTRENKAIKARFNGKKDILDSEEEEEDENENVEEEEKGSEGDYDDDEDVESDCQPTTSTDCSTTPDECDQTTNECDPVTTESTTTTTCHTTPCTCKSSTRTRKTTTTKCTTKFTCPTKCPTTEESTRCPKICAKGNNKAIHYPSPQKTKSWDSDGRKNRKKIQRKNFPNN